LENRDFRKHFFMFEQNLDSVLQNFDFWSNPGILEIISILDRNLDFRQKTWILNCALRHGPTAVRTVGCRILFYGSKWSSSMFPLWVGFAFLGANWNDAVFYRTYSLLYHKFENIVIYSLCNPGNQHYYNIIHFLSKNYHIPKFVVQKLVRPIKNGVNALARACSIFSFLLLSYCRKRNRLDQTIRRSWSFYQKTKQKGFTNIFGPFRSIPSRIFKHFG